MLSFLDRERSVAGPGFSRWLVPPAALALHLCIGQVYALSVFKKPLVAKMGASDTSIAIVFSIAIVMLGLSAAFGGKWMERNGPRKAMFLSAVCFSSGLLVGSLGVQTEQLWLLYLGYGVIGGIGLGIGYISPVSTLIKWFPDRPGLATGMAIMGFGGGAFIASALSAKLLAAYTSIAAPAQPTDAIVPAFVTLGLGYLVVMMFGVFTVRIPPEGWKPDGYVAKATENKMMTTANVSADNAIRTRQFWCLWVVLFCNVTAGIGILEQASPMIQAFFPNDVTAATAAGFVGLLSLFNMGGRFVWSSTSDVIGRKPTYALPGRGRHPVLLPGDCRQHRRPGLRHPVLPDPVVLRRRVRDRSGLPQGHVRHVPGRRDPRPPADRLVGGRCRRAADRQRHHPEPAGRGSDRRVGLPPVPAGHGRTAGGRVRRQPAGAPGQPEAPRDRARCAPSDGDRRHLELQLIRHLDRHLDDHHPDEHGGTAMSSSTQARHTTSETSNGIVARLVVAWTVVGIPLVYGIYQTAKKASALF